MGDDYAAARVASEHSESAAKSRGESPPKRRAELIEARVDDLAHDGAGVAKVGDKVYFIDGVLPGERIEFEPRHKRRGKFPGTLTRIIEPSPHRVAPRCEYFGVCGGCAQQHIARQTQLVFKEKTLFDNLARIGKTTPAHRLAALHAPSWNYRRKARPGVRYVQGRGVLLGFRQRRSSRISALQRCHTLDARLSALLPGLHELLNNLACRQSIPQLEMAAADNAVALVLRHLQPLSADDSARLIEFAQHASRAAPRGQSVQFFAQPGGLDSMHPLWPPSPEPLHYRIHRYDVTLRFAPSDFIQVNAAVNNLMVEQAMALLDPCAADSVLDLFCGLGNFTLPMARLGAQALGLEGDAALIRRAVENAAQNDLPRARFHTMNLMPNDAGDIFSQLEKIAAAAPFDNAPFDKTRFNKTRFNKILLDPPRSGAAEVVAQLIPRIKPRLIVYVSCNPATLARDAAELTARCGYQMTHAGVIDMFPHTAQIEAMARFER